MLFGSFFFFLKQNEEGTEKEKEEEKKRGEAKRKGRGKRRIQTGSCVFEVALVGATNGRAKSGDDHHIISRLLAWLTLRDCGETE